MVVELVFFDFVFVKFFNCFYFVFGGGENFKLEDEDLYFEVFFRIDYLLVMECVFCY